MRATGIAVGTEFKQRAILKKINPISKLLIFLRQLNFLLIQYVTIL